MRRIMWIAVAACAAGLAGGCVGHRVAAVDPEIRRSADAAGAALAAGATDRAAAGYEAALTRAALIDAPAEIARNAHNLAAVLVSAGRLDEADRRVDQALSSGGFDDAGRANALLLKSAIQRGRGNAEASHDLAEEAFVAAQGIGRRPAMIHARLLCAELDLAADRIPTARLELALARQFVRRDTPPELCAWVERLDGVLLVRDRRFADAAARFDAAAGRLKAAGRYRDMASALVLAGAALDQAESWAAATDRYLRAGRSQAAAGDAADAAESARLAAASAARASDAALQARVQAWSGTLFPAGPSGRGKP